MLKDDPELDTFDAALQALNRAQDTYQTAVAFKLRPARVEHARLMTIVAKEHFDRISMMLGDEC